MISRTPIYRSYLLHRSLREQVDALSSQARGIIARSLEILRENPAPDTFLGRQTFKPFPKEDEQ